ncbi:hypothetical protein VNI00_017637 [Paramarasmius palmivorus]|uniref:Uncharacterized protein n=1 Tax=Paramarasmius palmivorus TaxID=297713 RepID=A0AAW0B4G6_9AGAR
MPSPSSNTSQTQAQTSGTTQSPVSSAQNTEDKPNNGESTSTKKAEKPGSQPHASESNSGTDSESDIASYDVTTVPSPSRNPSSRGRPYTAPVAIPLDSSLDMVQGALRNNFIDALYGPFSAAGGASQLLLRERELARKHNIRTQSDDTEGEDRV